MVLAKVTPFAVEQWMDKYELEAKYNVAETCVASISLDDLKGLSEDKDSEIWSSSTKLTYGAIRGSEKLRKNLAQLYSAKKPMSVDDVLITPGAIAANMTAFYGLIGNGDHVICHYPTYQQLFEIPKILGAEVDFWRAREEKNWQLEIEELKALIRPNTKMIVINNPQNPTGAVIPKPTLEALIEIAAYSLAGIRVGWIASRSPEIIEACAQARDYTTISLAKRNLEVLDNFVDSFKWACDWVKPVAGTTAFVKFSKMGQEVDDVAFCEKLLQDTGVMLCPGSRCFGQEFKGFVRFGFCCETNVLENGLEAMRIFMKRSYQTLPLADEGS
ncbi:hypothetical protein P7C71_g630, partial [Lecanoromycetidae sp. Uapishka_2]